MPSCDSPTDDAPPRLAISACLLGHAVRYDGGHKRDDSLVADLGRHVEWVPVCPEVELGLGVPRETIRLELHDDGLHLVATESGADHTRAMRRFAIARVAALRRLGLSGYVLKQGSPSCGLVRVPVHRRAGARTARTGRGAFSSALLHALPLLPVEEEGRLADPRRRADFLSRVFGYHRLQRLLARRPTTDDLVAFHAAHELKLLAHSPTGCRTLDRLVACAQEMPLAALRDAYAQGFMAALARRATPGKQARALRRALDRLRGRLDPASRAELVARIDEHRRGLTPLDVPRALLRRHAREIGDPLLEGQVGLLPPPRERLLRGSV